MIRIPLTNVTIIGGVLVGVLLISGRLNLLLGVIFILKSTRIQRCYCKMCNENYTIVEQIGKTGNSVIYVAEKQEGK